MYPRLRPPQRGQTKPFGHRCAVRCSPHRTSSPKRERNSLTVMMDFRFNGPGFFISDILSPFVRLFKLDIHLSFFMLPIPAAFIERFILLLRKISAVGAEQVIALFGVPVAREDTTLFLPEASLSIGDACSGFSALYASVTLALILAYMNRSWPRGLVTLGAAFPIAMACNILRNALLALIVQRWGGGILHTVLHPASGMLMFTAAAALLAFLSRVGMRGP